MAVRKSVSKTVITEPKFSEEPVEGSLNDTGRNIRIENRTFENETFEKRLNMKEFYECVFKNVRFGSEAKNCLFADVIFDHCDLSNLKMDSTVFRRVRMTGCRMTGTELSRASLQDTVISGCQCGYINLNGAKLKRVMFENCIMEQAGMSMLEHTGTSFSKCDLSGAEFIDTKLGGWDLSDSKLDGITVDPMNLRGLTVNDEQAAAFAALLGITVKHVY